MILEIATGFAWGLFIGSISSRVVGEAPSHIIVITGMFALYYLVAILGLS